MHLFDAVCLNFAAEACGCANMTQSVIFQIRSSRWPVVNRMMYVIAFVGNYCRVSSQVDLSATG